MSDWSHSPWVILVLAIILILFVLRGAVTGSAGLFFRTYQRSEVPGLYWFAMIVSGILGIGGLIIAIRAMI